MSVSIELLEREALLVALSEWLSSANREGGLTVLIAGEAGMGKTALLREFSRRQSEVRVLWGSCDALITPRPLGPLHDIARQTQGPLLAALHSASSPDAIFTATLDEFERTKTLVVIEDVHWADEATLDLLKFLGRRIHRTHVLLAVTFRDEELNSRHPLRLVIGDLPSTSTHRIALAPLSEEAVTRLAEESQRPVTRLHQITGGNPFYVTEVLAGAADTVPPTVRDAVLVRAVRLSPAARQVAELVCIVPGSTDRELLEQIAHPDEGTIDSCLSIGMVRGEDGSLAFRHELARRALEDSLSPQTRRRLHAEVLEALARRPEMSAAQCAHHADGAHDAAQVLRHAPLAGQEAAAVGAHREAASHYKMALRHALKLAPVERARLLEQFSYECYLTGETQEAFDAQRSALELWRALKSAREEGNALWSLSRLSWYMGDNSRSADFCSKAIETLRQLAPGPELARAYCNQASLAMEAHEADAAINSGLKALEIGERLSHTGILCDALATLGTVRLIIGDASGWMDLERMLALSLAAGLQEQVARAYTALAAMGVSQRLYERAAGYTEAGLAYCEEHDLDFLRPYLLAYRARMRFERGEWDDASSDVEAVLREPRTAAVTRIPALRTLAHIRVRRGDPDVEGPVAQARSLAGTKPVLQWVGMLAVVCAEAAWLAGNPAGVIDEVRQVYELSRRTRDPRMNGELAAWLWRVDALDEPPLDLAEPYAREISGDWRGAANDWRALGCPYEQASLLAWHGTESDQREALTLFETLGAKPAVQALRRQMRIQGIRQIPRGARSSTRGHPLGLTRREAEILALMSQGLRNAKIAKRLFVSTKTVEHHISAILGKLSVRSRTEAIALLRAGEGSSAEDA